MSANWSLPTTSSLYNNFVAELDARLDDLVMMMSDAVVTATNVPTNAVRWNTTLRKWQKFNGTDWTTAAFTDYLDVPVTSWRNNTTLTLAGAASGTVAINGYASATTSTLTLTLADSGVTTTGGTIGSASAVPVITYNRYGLITAVSSAALGTIATQNANAVNITGGTLAGVTMTASVLRVPTAAAPSVTLDGQLAWDNDGEYLVLYDANTGAGTMVIPSTVSINTLTNKSLSDTTTDIINAGDGTKKIKFDASPLSTGTTITLKVPAASGTQSLAVLESAQTYTSVRTITIDDAATNTTTDLLKLYHSSTGAVAAGFGSGLMLGTEATSGGAVVDGVQIVGKLVTIGASPTYSLDVLVKNAGAFPGSPSFTVNPTNINLPTGSTYNINGTSVLSATTLGTGVTASSLTSLGTIATLTCTTLVVNTSVSSNILFTQNTDRTFGYSGNGTTTGSGLTVISGTALADTDAAAYNGGVLTISTGAGSARTVAASAAKNSGAGGALNITAGNGGAILGTNTAFTSTGGIGGAITKTAGTGGAASGSTTQNTGGAGGALTIQAGTGGASTTATAGSNTGGTGGTLNIYGGTGGNASSATTTNTAGAGGGVTILGGAAGSGTGNINGGTINIDAGTALNTGTSTINIGTSTIAGRNKVVNIGNTTTTDSITIDAKNAGTITLGTGTTIVQLLSSYTKVGNTTLVQGGTVNITFPTLAGTLIGSGDSASAPLAVLNIAGGTDIGEALADTDEFVMYNISVTSNRKAQATRIRDYIAVTSGAAVTGAVRYTSTGANAGCFDGGTTTPTGTTRLNYGGYFYPTRLNLVGEADTNTAATHYFVEIGTDGIVRPKTLANVQSEIVTSAVLGSGTPDSTTVLKGDRTWGVMTASSVGPTISTQTGNFVAAANYHYCLVTAGSAQTVTIPTGSAGDIIWITVCNNRTDNVLNVTTNSTAINGDTTNMTIDQPYATIMLRYIDATQKWRTL